ncbi:L,D-transpeptidase family protein [Oceanicella actignis]|uniref:L,D-transpeptidase family protein n=1 Tax=Oceanicella actignis TaxID=1189325 RepID=UPI0011E86700|nr:L,D-transpeptidase family protein [Oceanicella actignis]TYO88460.1 murein L,D-transpeptidase YcbB/YkuD [Oceanicella actignis]
MIFRPFAIPLALLLALTLAPDLSGPRAASGAASGAAQERGALAPAPWDEASWPAALGAELAGDAALRRAYEARAWRPLWLDDAGRGRAGGLLSAIEDASAHALPLPAGLAEDLRAAMARAQAPGPDAMRAAARAEAALSRALLRVGTGLASGALDPSRVDPEIQIRPERPAPERLIALAAQARDGAALRAALESLAPANADYAALRALYAELGRLARAGVWPPEDLSGPTLRRGDRGPRVARLRARLALMGDLAEPAPAEDPELFDEALERALRAFQRRHGLNDDGVAGALSFEALGASAQDRMRQAAVNLERIRWRPRAPAPRRIEVNLADFRMTLFENGAPVHSARIVAGKAPRFRTPEFDDEMTHLVFNPIWNVPRSIAVKEILPKLREDPAYLERNGMRLVGRDGAPLPPEQMPADFSAFDADRFPFLVKQDPSEENALGRVKFMFPNRFSIYMHDTPAKRLFARDRRAYSHGCVRVEDPFALARRLLAPQYPDVDERMARWLEAGREVYVTLRPPMPVHIGYRTVWVAADGTPQFRADVYGRDARLYEALRAQGLSDPPSGEGARVAEAGPGEG